MNSSRLFIICITGWLYLPVNGDVGSWVSPFAGSNYGHLGQVASIGNRVFLSTDFGVGTFDAATGSSAFDYYKDIGIPLPVYTYKIAVRDSANIALYKSDASKREIYLVNSGKPTRLQCPGNVRACIYESPSSIWVASDSALYFFDGAIWTKHPYPAQYPVARPQNLVKDATDALWFDVSSNSIGKFSAQQFSEIPLHEGTTGNTYTTVLISHKDQLFAVTNSILYQLSGSGIVTEHQLNTLTGDTKERIAVVASATMTPSGNLALCVRSENSTYFLHRISLTDSSVKTVSLPRAALLASVSNGFAALNDSTVDIYQGDDLKATSVKYSALYRNSLSGMYQPAQSSYRFTLNDRSILQVAFSLASKAETGIMQVQNERISYLPDAPSVITCFLQHPDGTLYTGTENGLFVLRDSMWNAVEALANLYIRSMTFDSGYRIWGTTINQVFHELGNKWELIDYSNSTLPSFSTPRKSAWYQFQGPGTLCIDGRDKKLLLLPDSVYSSIDGFDWKSMPLVKSTYSALCKLANDSVMVASTFNRSLFVCNLSSTEPRLDSLVASDNKMVAHEPLIDSRGGVWLPRTRGSPGGPAILRYLNSVWTIYDSTNAPFTWGVPSIESPAGCVRIVTQESKLLIFEYDTAEVSNVNRSLRTHSRPLALGTGISPRGTYVMSTLPCSGPVTVLLISSLGRHVRTLYKEHHAAGLFKLALPGGIAPGVYAVRLSAAGGDAYAKVLVH